MLCHGVHFIVIFANFFKPMKYLTVALIAIICCCNAVAQTYEIGVMAGGLNYIGDVGRTNYIYPNAPAVGGILKWNRSPRHSFRASILAGNIKANDLNSDETSRQQRGLSFDSPFVEASLGIEYTFWEFDMTRGFSLPGTPYLFAGVNYFYHKEYGQGFDQDGNLVLRNFGNEFDFSIPIALGYKQAISRHFILAAEVGARYMLTDNIDGSAPGPKIDSGPFGNPNNNDWYVFSGIILTYTFGRQPCYCGF
jgi:hypothetical protein